jgi:class 3 adenylate cyclase/tetratricopeptide (TPR) repeat protein
MPCPGCAFEVAPEFAFCPKCGLKLPAACPSCGFACPPEFSFCPKCGARQAPEAPAQAVLPTAEQRLTVLQERMPEDLAAKLRAATEAGSAAGERRPVTMLFADISGFTALAEALDPEEVATLIDRCLGAMAEAIYRYEGTVDKYIGDCVMALFGAPVAHENDPERAIHAALEMRRRVAAINDELAVGQTDPMLTMHVGVNTGVVVAGAVGHDRRRDYTVLGDAVNVAARLEAAAGPGEVVVGPETHHRTRHVFDFEPLGELTLKGKAAPLAAYRVLGPLATPGSARGLEALGLKSRLVGRDGELEQLLAAFDRALRGRTQVVSLIGEAGAGKSRLLRELFERLQAEGRLAPERVAVRTASCSALGEQPYGVLSAFFREAYGLAPSDPASVARQKLLDGLAMLGADAEALARTAPLVGHVLGVGSDDPRLRYVEPEQLKRQLFLAVRNILELCLQRGPLILVVEDLHWADAASVELLRFLVDRLGDRHLMVLTTHRPSFEAAVLVGSRATHTAIRLAPLTADDGQTLLAGFFKESLDRIRVDLRALIVERAGGNPFYLEEIVRGLVEAGVLARGPDGWTCAADVATPDVPPTVEGVLLSRLDRLPPGTRRCVQEAAVLGTTFDEQLLRAISGEPESLELHLDLLHDAELVEELPVAPGGSAAADPRYGFVHALVQEVAYHSLLQQRRAELHGRAATTLERLCAGRAERVEDLEALGHHFSLSADRARGARYLLAAGDWARAIYANEHAARHYQRALETLGHCDPVTTRLERLAVRERLGDVLGPGGRRDEALGHYIAVLEACEEIGDRPAQARLRRQIGALHWAAGDRDRALAYYQTGLVLLEGQGEHIELASLYQEIGRLAFRSGAHREAIDWARRALALAERIAAADPERRKEAAEAIAQAHNTLGVALARTGALEEAVAEIERSVAVAREYELLQVACRAYANLGVLYSSLDPEQAIEISQQGLELARKIGDLGLQPWLYANLAGAYCTFTGQCGDEGIAAAEAAIELDRQLGQRDHLSVPLIVLGQIYQCNGEVEPALRYYQEALELAEEMREPQLLFPCYDGLATLYLDLGDEVRAERYMRKAQDVCEQAGLEPDSLVALPFLG